MCVLLHLDVLQIQNLVYMAETLKFVVNRDVSETSLFVEGFSQQHSLIMKHLRSSLLNGNLAVLSRPVA